jgi:hypothetical protein
VTMPTDQVACFGTLRTDQTTENDHFVSLLCYGLTAREIIC